MFCAGNRGITINVDWTLSSVSRGTELEDETVTDSMALPSLAITSIGNDWCSSIAFSGVIVSELFNKEAILDFFIKEIGFKFPYYGTDDEIGNEKDWWKIYDSKQEIVNSQITINIALDETC